MLEYNPEPIERGDVPERMSGLIRDVEAALGVQITLHDRRGMFRARDGTPLLAAHTSHFHAYCEYGRKRIPGWDRNCYVHCMLHVERLAAEVKAPFLTLCWKGVQEVVIPIVRDGLHVATLFAGQFRHPRGKRRPTRRAFPGGVCAAYGKLPATDMAKVKRITRVVHAVGQGLLREMDEMHLPGPAGPDRRAVIRRCLYYQAHQPLTLADLARALHLSPSRTSHLVRELFGLPFQELLLRERIQRACALLLSSTATVAEIARRVGVPNAYYFNRLFAKRVGLPPGRFRRQGASTARRD